MRLITFIVAIIAASAPASAQGWREYEYPNEGFTVAFPAEPKVEITSYQASGGGLVEARVLLCKMAASSRSRSPICRVPRCQKATSWPMRY